MPYGEEMKKVFDMIRYECPKCDDEGWLSWDDSAGPKRHKSAEWERPMGMLEDDLTEARRMRLRDQKIEKLSAALEAMVDRWEPDCEGQDRVMWENAVEALQFAKLTP
jgi:hypothetical protein